MQVLNFLLLLKDKAIMNAFEWMFIALLIVGLVTLLSYTIHMRYAGTKLSNCSEHNINAVLLLDHSSVILSCDNGAIDVPSGIDFTNPTPITITLKYALLGATDARLHVLNADNHQPLVGELKSISCVGQSRQPSSPQALCAAPSANDSAPQFVVQKFEANLSAMQQPSSLVLALNIQQPSDARIIIDEIGVCFN